SRRATTRSGRRRAAIRRLDDHQDEEGCPRRGGASAPPTAGSGRRAAQDLERQLRRQGAGEETRPVEADIAYARSGGVAIAYQVMGEGDVDLVYVPDYMSNLVFAMRYPRWRSFYDSLAARFRLILFDKRDTGLSDHGGQFAALETRMEDMHAVLDAAGSARTVVLASHEGCAMAALYAATYPERTAALAMFHPVGWGPQMDPAALMAELADLRDRWGTRELADEILRDHCPSLLASEEDRAWFADYLRVGASPAVAYALNRAFAEVDLGGVLPAVRV